MNSEPKDQERKQLAQEIIVQQIVNSVMLDFGRDAFKAVVTTAVRNALFGVPSNEICGECPINLSASIPTKGASK